MADFSKNVGRQRSDLRGLQDHGTAGSDRSACLRNHRAQWGVPGGNRSDNPRRDPLDLRAAELLEPFNLADKLGNQVEFFDCALHLGARCGRDRVAKFRDDRSGNFVCARLGQSRELAEISSSLFDGRPRPGRKSPHSGLHSALDIFGGAARDYCDGLFGDGVRYGQDTGGLRGNPGAIDINVLVLNHWITMPV